MSSTLPGRKHPDAKESSCPPWCEEQDRETHWSCVGGVWQTVHVKSFGSVSVNFPDEVSQDKSVKPWLGRAEIIIESERETFYPEDAAVLAQSLRSADEFARKLDQLAIKLARAGHIETSLDLDLAYPPESTLQGWQQAEETTK